MKIIVDAFGGDHAPLEIMKGCAEAVQELDVDIILTGKEQAIHRIAKQNGISLYRMEIVDAPDVITMHDPAGEIVKSKSESSMAIGLKLLAEGKGDAFLSGGNSGALVMGSSLLIKRIKGVKRASFGAIMPKAEGFMMLMDGGANLECRPEMLQQFGIMGSIYMEKVMNVKNPRVGLVNVGTEEEKGGELQQQAFVLLKNSPINFVGNIEGREIPDNAADVVVADGFTGNILLKTYEGVAMMVMKQFKNVMMKSTKNKLAALAMKNDFMELKQRMDYNEYGGAPIMGVCKPVFKAHGSSKAKTIKNALRLTKAYVETNVIDVITKSIQELSGSNPTGQEG